MYCMDSPTKSYAMAVAPHYSQRQRQKHKSSVFSRSVNMNMNMNCGSKPSLLIFKGSPALPITRRKRFLRSPEVVVVMGMQDCTVKMEVDVPVSAAYKCYSDREAIPQWMPFISTVEVLEDKPDLSRWTLKYKAFGRNIQLSWLARNLQPIPNQKVHWRSVEGLPNGGAVRFYPKGPSSCIVELTVSYEVPPILVPVASALQPFLQSLLLRGLERFSTFAKRYQTESSA